MTNIFSIIIYCQPLSSLRRFGGKWLTESFSNNFFNFMEIQKKNTKLNKFCQNLQFLTVVFFVTEISNWHFCKLDKLFRDFLSWQFLVFLIVLKIVWFEICIFAQLSCDMLEGYCRTVLVTCTLITKACSITLRFFSIVQWTSIPQLSNKLAVGCEWWMKFLCSITLRFFISSIPITTKKLC